MNTNDLNTALYEKMAAEQDKFREWLKIQPPEEVLNHAYEYTIREDIVMAMEELELTDTQAQALWESPSPLADVYRYFEKLETGYMDAIRDSIENRADDVCRAKEELRTTPVYPHSAAYASEHGEMAQYNLSYQANSACKEAIGGYIPAAGTTVGGCEGNPYPTLQTFITGIDTPFAEGGTAFLRRTFLRFFFLSVSLSFACLYRII